MAEIIAAVVAAFFTWAAMSARKQSETIKEIFQRLNRLETTQARLEEKLRLQNK